MSILHPLRASIVNRGCSMISQEHQGIIQIKKFMEPKALLMLFHIQIFLNGILVQGTLPFYGTITLA
jgi:hypothetical protein